MYKKILLNVLCLVSTISFAQVGLNVNIKMHDDQKVRQIKQTIIVDENVPMVLEHANFVVHVTAVVHDDKVLVEVKMFEKVDDELVLRSSPVLLLEFGKSGYVKLGKKVADEDVSSLIVEINPFFVE
jgi:hypothetical protein